MQEEVHAVITGDIVDSTAISNDYHHVLNEIANDIKQYHETDFKLEISRGDSFQGFIKDPAKALLISTLIRAGLRRNTRGVNRNDNIWDARISIGIDTVTPFPISADARLGALSGPAFVRSGRGLDTMKDEGALLKIITTDDQLNKDFAAWCPLIDAIIARWTVAQAEAVYLYLLKDSTQEEIGKYLQKSQRAIGKRLETSDIERIKNLFNRYEEIITWKYRK